MPVESATKRGFAVFEGRVIYEAQKPITSEQLAAIEAQIGCAVPAGLRALWETTFGGRVGYDLEIEFGGHVASFSFNEIFFPGGDTYRDLPERIDYERELAEEAGHTGPLRFLPFGGFEYLDRLYVGLTAPHEGAVFAWMQGLPSAWALRLHNVSVGRIADAVPTLFRLLAFKQDPFGLGDTYNAGHEMAGAMRRWTTPTACWEIRCKRWCGVRCSIGAAHSERKPWRVTHACAVSPFSRSQQRAILRWLIAWGRRLQSRRAVCGRRSVRRRPVVIDLAAALCTPALHDQDPRLRADAP